MKCDKCNIDMKIISVKMAGEVLKAKQCPHCENRIISLDLAMKMHDRILPKIRCEKKIIKVGESSAITIPKDIKQFFQPGAHVTLDFDPQEMLMTIKKIA